MIPLPAADCSTKLPHNQIEAISKPKLSQCRAGNNMAFPVILALSFPNAITEPDKVTAPMRIPK